MRETRCYSAHAMNPTTERPMETLEKEQVRTEDKPADSAHPVKKDWRSALGAFPDDELTRSAFRLGREYRDAQLEP